MAVFSSIVVLMAICGQPKITLDEATRQKLTQIAFNAAREGDVETLTAYIKSGLPLDVLTPRGDSLLILAAYYGHASAVELLATQPQSKINMVNKMGFTALTGAAYKGDVNVTKILLKYGANVNVTNTSGQTPLMFAAMMGRVDIARLLINAGAKINVKTTDGDTPLSLAKQHGHELLIPILTAK